MSSTSNLQLHTKCLICGSSKITPLKGYNRDHLYKCAKCLFVFSRPIPSNELLDKTYKNYGRAHHHEISPITIKRYRELLSIFETHRQLNKILDVGCGSGHFLESASKHGWEAYGTEFSESLYNLCLTKGLNMALGNLDPASYRPESFDVVTSFEVIEHINNPLEELSKFYKLLRPGGIVYCTTPNFNAVQRLINGQNFRTILSYPEHLSYYTPKTLKAAFERVGFKTLSIGSTGIALSRVPTPKSTIAMANNAKDHSQVSGEESARLILESSNFLKIAKRSLNFVLSALGVGLTIKATFGKPVR